MEKAIEFVLSCMNFDGGFGCRPGSESHAGQVILHLEVYTGVLCCEWSHLPEFSVYAGLHNFILGKHPVFHIGICLFVWGSTFGTAD